MLLKTTTANYRMAEDDYGSPNARTKCDRNEAMRNEQQTERSEQGSPKPLLVACGQRQIRSRTGQLFPAYLIRLPIITKHTQAPVNSADRGADDNSRDTVESNYGYRWRSKKDFLLFRHFIVRV